MTERVVWRGQTFDKRTANMLEELARISGDIYINPTQGSYNTSVSASGNTHAGGGAGDLMHTSWEIADFNTVVKLARKIGFAAWHRTPQQSNWPRHAHLIAVQPGGRNDKGVLSDAAWQQVKDYYDGFNGLAGRGRDDGPRDWVGVTWEDYYARNHPVEVVLDNLKYGRTHDDVKDLQRALERHMRVDLAVDGKYGSQTETQVLRCQRDHGFGNDKPGSSFVGKQQAIHLGLKPISAAPTPPPGPAPNPEEPEDVPGIVTTPGLWKWYSDKPSGEVQVFPDGDWHRLVGLDEPASGIKGGSEERMLYLRIILPKGRTADRVVETKFVRTGGDETAMDSEEFGLTKDSHPYNNVHFESGEGRGGKWYVKVTGGREPITITTRYAKCHCVYVVKA